MLTPPPGTRPSVAEEVVWEMSVKRGLTAGTSNGVIDGHYQRALGAGATGGKLLGAGGGGFLLLDSPNQGTAMPSGTRRALKGEAGYYRLMGSADPLDRVLGLVMVLSSDPLLLRHAIPALLDRYRAAD